MRAPLALSNIFEYTYSKYIFAQEDPIIYLRRAPKRSKVIICSLSMHSMKGESDCFFCLASYPQLIEGWWWMADVWCLCIFLCVKHVFMLRFLFHKSVRHLSSLCLVWEIVLCVLLCVTLRCWQHPNICPTAKGASKYESTTTCRYTSTYL